MTQELNQFIVQSLPISLKIISDVKIVKIENADHEPL